MDGAINNIGHNFLRVNALMLGYVFTRVATCN